MGFQKFNCRQGGVAPTRVIVGSGDCDLRAACREVLQDVAPIDKSTTEPCCLFENKHVKGAHTLCPPSVMSREEN